MFIFSNSSLVASRLICVSLSFCNNRKRIATTVTKENLIPAGRAQKEERTMQWGSLISHYCVSQCGFQTHFFAPQSVGTLCFAFYNAHTTFPDNRSLTPLFKVSNFLSLCFKISPFLPFVRLCYCIAGFKQTWFPSKRYHLCSAQHYTVLPPSSQNNLRKQNSPVPFVVCLKSSSSFLVPKEIEHKIVRIPQNK